MSGQIEPAPEQDVQEAFEAHFRGQLNFERNEWHPEFYTFLPTRQAWDAWQEAVKFATTHPTQTEQQPMPFPESWWKLIHDTLRNYRMGTLDDGYGGGYPLIDAMTADGQPVSGGIEECTYLADAIWNALLTAPVAQTATQPELVMPVALGSVNADYDKGWADHAAEVRRLNAALFEPSA